MRRNETIRSLTIRSVDVDRRSDLHHGIQSVDVLVPESHAAMANRMANTGRIVGSMNAVAVAEVEPVSAEHALVFTLIGAERRDHDIAASNDLVPLLGVAEGCEEALVLGVCSSADDGLMDSLMSLHADGEGGL